MLDQPPSANGTVQPRTARHLDGEPRSTFLLAQPAHRERDKERTGAPAGCPRSTITALASASSPALDPTNWTGYASSSARSSSVYRDRASAGTIATGRLPVLTACGQRSWTTARRGWSGRSAAERGVILGLGNAANAMIARFRCFKTNSSPEPQRERSRSTVAPRSTRAWTVLESRMECQ
jgi:hypothetical protein